VIEEKQIVLSIIIIGEAISVDDCKIIGTSLAGILQFFMGFNWLFFIVSHLFF
jgi:hypothetical protein